MATGPGLRAMDVEGGGERCEVSDCGVVHAETVGAQDAHPARPCDLAHPPLARRAIRARLRKARREHHGRTHAPLGARFDGLDGSVGRDRHDGDVDHAGHLGDARMRLDPLNPVAAWVDRPDCALESGFLQVAQRPAADPGRVFGGADDCDGAGVEEGVEP